MQRKQEHLRRQDNSRESSDETRLPSSRVRWHVQAKLQMCVKAVKHTLFYLLFHVD